MFYRLQLFLFSILLVFFFASYFFYPICCILITMYSISCYVETCNLVSRRCRCRRCSGFVFAFAFCPHAHTQTHTHIRHKIYRFAQQIFIRFGIFFFPILFEKQFFFRGLSLYLIYSDVMMIKYVYIHWLLLSFENLPKD